MDNKRDLLGSLAINDDERESSSNLPRYLITGVGAIGLALAAWIWLVPDNTPLTVNTAKARQATADLLRQSSAVLDASGYVTARRKATVSSKITGKVTQVLVEEGDFVEKGQLLATLDDSIQKANYMLVQAKLKASKARLNEVEVLIQEAALNYQRTTELETRNLASTADLDRTRLALAGLRARLVGLETDVEVANSSVKVSYEQLRDTEIRAPFTGVVILKAAQPGEMISPISGGGAFIATGICTIVDMNSLEIEVDVSESYINRVKPGQPATATLNAYQDWKIPAEVIAIIPTADRSKATVRVRVAFLEKDDRILPEMGVKVAFLQEDDTQSAQAEIITGVFVSTNAILAKEEGYIVYVVIGDRAEPRVVTLGRRTGSQRNIVSGLEANEVVVTGLDAELAAQLGGGRLVSTNK